MPKRKYSRTSDQQSECFPQEQQPEPPSKKSWSKGDYVLDSLTRRWARFGRTSSDLWEWATYTAQWPGDDGVYYSPAAWYWWWTWNRWTTARAWSESHQGRGTQQQ